MGSLTIRETNHKNHWADKSVHLTTSLFLQFDFLDSVVASNTSCAPSNIVALLPPRKLNES